MKSVFSTKLKELRQEKRITLTELVKIIKVDKSAISFWENEINEPKASYIVAIAKYFDVLPTICWAWKIKLRITKRER